MLRTLLRLPYSVLAGAVLVWWLAFWIPTVLYSGPIDDSLEVANATTRSGSSYNQLLVVSLAGIGVLALARWSPRAASRETVIAVWLLIAYVLWAMTSTFWSDDLGLSVRRLTSLLLLVVGSAGLGTGLYGARRDGIDRLCRHLLVSAAVLLCMLGSVLLLRGDLIGFADPGWSLKSSIKLSMFGYYVGYAAVAALCLSRPKRSIQLCMFALCLAVLVMLKGRGVILSTLAASGIVLFRTLHNRICRAAALIVGILSTGVVLDLGSGGHVIRGVTTTLASTVWVDYLTLSAGLDNVLDLSGRGPLWEVLLEYVQQNPLGYGFGTFWTPDRLLVVQSQAGWPAVNAHNGLLDEVLATGVVGVSLALVTWAWGVRLSVTAARDPRLRDGAVLVGGWLHLMFLFNMTDSSLQFFFEVPPILTMIAVATLLSQQSAGCISQPSGARARTSRPNAQLERLAATRTRSHGYSS